MNTENKTAILGLPSASTTVEAIKNNAPMGIAIGGGAAGLVNLLAELRRARQQQASKDKGEVLEVQIPTPASSKPKVATFVPSGIAPTIKGLLDAIKSNPGQAARIGVPITAGIAAGATGLSNTLADYTDTSKGWQAPLELGALAIPAVATYAGVNGIISSLRQKREQQRLESAKKQYAQLLGNELVGNKTASFPLCEEVVRIMAGAAASEFNVPVNGTTKIAEFNPANRALALGVSVPTMLAVLAGIASHKYMYDREQSAIAGAKMTPTRIKPPSQIRLVSAPSPADEKAQEVGDLPAESAEKTASRVSPLTLAASDVALGNFLINETKEQQAKKEEDKINPETGMPYAKKLKPQAKDNFVDANTLVVNTPTGSVVIDAADPAVLKLLHEKQKDLAQRMQSASVLPTNSTNF